MPSSFLLTFCRCTLALVFIYAFVTKARNFSLFERTIRSLGIVPAPAIRIASVVTLFAEFSTCTLLLVGGHFVEFGFYFSIFLLLVFSVILMLILTKRDNVSCNCFGSTDRPVSVIDLVRNTGFMVCGLLGLALGWTSNGTQAELGVVELSIAGVSAMAFVGMWTNIKEITELFRT